MTLHDREERREIYLAAIEHFGPAHQMVKAMEEMAELTKEIAKCLDAGGNYEAMAEETADVIIMTEQLQEILDALGHGEDIDRTIDRKIERLRERLNLEE